MKIKKTLFILIVSFFSIGSLIAQGGPPGGPGGPPGLPGSGGETEGTTFNVSDNDNAAPIDGQIWVGLIGGLAIGGYFFMKKRAIKID
ncbi:hypothetical protein P700755_002472 [Psychroflexus torquis ATCC 700755]|uniref:Uncharacterized protein n=1 Tax=Psychroflexus torquis (strain ATCC 700755 / CIP 106069 / ACAM 623) TaxID=313595 RepID=K4IFB4_PSYTT|nr:hypothetical protein [Psychroflexus torquis]AFU69237.1 hypothetical protein P700755_002472 [Psychroflexus torquis ATCC 700755]